MSIQDNVEARKVSEEAFQLVSELIQESASNAEVMRLAWVRLGSEIDQVTQTERPQEPSQELLMMSDDEAKRFERKPMPFGKYGPAGECFNVGDVPLSYLVMIDEDEFRESLRRYLRRREVWEEQEA